nr:hypothetical protein [Candidatus Sigynarchaeum springense]
MTSFRKSAESYLCAGIAAVILGVMMFAAAPKNQDPEGVQLVGGGFVILGIVMVIGAGVKMSARSDTRAIVREDPFLHQMQMARFREFAREELHELLRAASDEGTKAKIQDMIKFIECSTMLDEAGQLLALRIPTHVRSFLRCKDALKTATDESTKLRLQKEIQSLEDSLAWTGLKI